MASACGIGPLAKSYPPAMAGASRSPEPSPPGLRLAVLASGRGSNLRALLDAHAGGALASRVVGVFSDRPSCQALARAAAAGIPTWSARPAAYPSREAFDAALLDAVLAVQPDLIVCAGYMRMLSADAVRRSAGRMINIHPSLLPDFPGLDTHARALAAGAPAHGASVHLVTEDLDAGPVLAQARVPVLPGDDREALAARVLEREHPLLIAAVRALEDGTIGLAGGQIFLRGAPLRRPLALSAQGRLEESA